MALPFEIVPFEMPTSLEGIDNSRIGKQILDLHSMIEPDFRLTDRDITDALAIMKNMEFLIARDPNYTEDILGFATHIQYDDYPESLCIPYLGVRLTAQRAGIGRTLLRTIEHIALNEGNNSLILAMPDPELHPEVEYVSPQAFYEKLGFELIDPKKRIMELELPRKQHQSLELPHIVHQGEFL